MTDGHQTPTYEPTEDEIRAACEAIRAGWRPEVEAARAVVKPRGVVFEPRW